MTLDDFFTFTEMNNGLTVPSRVKELVAVMHNERDCVVKNIGEATRQWSAVANAIAATENRDCLDLFVQLDGIHFIGKWLKNAQKFSNDSSDSFVEESITHLLQALKLLHLDYEKLVATEIWTTVKDLVLHNNSSVQDKAQVLFESWKKKRDGDTSLPDVDNSGASIANKVEISADIGKESGHAQRDDSLRREISFRQKGLISTGDYTVSSTSSDAVNTGKVENRQHSDKMLDEKVGNEISLDRVESSSLPTPAMELPASHSNGATSIESCNLAVSREDTSNGRLESASDINHTPKVESSQEKVGPPKEGNLENRPSPSSSDAADAMKSVTEPSPQTFSSSADKSLGNECSPHTDQRKIDSDGKGTANDSDSANQCRNSSAFPSEEGREHRILSKSSCNESWENTKELGSLLSGTEEDEKMKISDLLHASGGNMSTGYKSAKKETHNEPDKAWKKPDIELYRIVDPVEVARQVTIEVEREVVNYNREQSLGASEKLVEDNVQQTESPDSMWDKTKEEENDQDLSAESSSSQEEESATSTENLDTEQQSNGTQDMHASQVTEAAQEEINAEKCPCNFDLNQELSSEDDDHSGARFSTPVSIVSASRAAAAPGLPVAPLQFEGTLGWKGSAATSAFHPASKQRHGLLDIDLNVGGNTTDGKTGDPSLDKNVPSHSSLSSVDTNSRRSERLELDLNCTSEDGPRSLAQFFPLGNGDHSRSNSSSSSSKQPSLKNVDLNDQPSFLNESSNKSYLSQNLNLSEGIKSEDSVISIMGRRVEVNRKKDFLSEVPHGKTTELSFDANLGKSAVGFLGIGSVLPYANHPSMYEYNNVPSGSGPGPAMGFSSSVYGSGGPISYMMDSRGPLVIPQVIGSASPFQTGYSQSPFFINMANPNGVGAIGPSRSSFDDINNGTNVGGGSKGTAGFSQFLSLDCVRSVDEQLRPNSQTVMSPVVGGKRKEPDNGWEKYPFKHYTPP